MNRDVVEGVAHSIRGPRRRRASIERELRAHLEDSRAELVAAGLQPAEAESESVSRLGDPVEIASAFNTVYRPSRRTQFGLALALAGGMILGVWGIGGSLASATSAHHGTPASHVTVVTKHSPHNR